MALKVKIQPTKILGNTIVELSAYITYYDLDSTTCQTYWWVSDENGNKIYDGNYTIPPEVINEWGNNDFIIIKSIADNICLKIIE